MFGGGFPFVLRLRPQKNRRRPRTGNGARSPCPSLPPIACVAASPFRPSRTSSLTTDSVGTYTIRVNRVSLRCQPRLFLGGLESREPSLISTSAVTKILQLDHDLRGICGLSVPNIVIDDPPLRSVKREAVVSSLSLMVTPLETTEISFSDAVTTSHHLQLPHAACQPVAHREK
jgi:hypothetical protein